MIDRTLASLLLAGALAACGESHAQQDFSKVELKVEKIAPGVAVLFGQGGNIGVSYGEDASIIIDDQYAPLTDKIAAAVKSLDPDPIRFVVNTHWHGDHTGGNENFGKGGAVIVAHDNVRARMAADQVSQVFKRTIPASPRAALPVVTFGQELRLHHNGDVLRVIHAPSAHTDGDAIIWFEKANVVHMGDLFFNGLYPFIDTESGGGVQGMIAAADRVLAMANDQTRIIPGHGPMASKADLKIYRDYLADITAKVQAGIKAGRTLEQIAASKPSAAYDAKYAGKFISPDQLVFFIHTSLTRPPR